jgi:putative transcriptional regulator
MDSVVKVKFGIYAYHDLISSVSTIDNAIQMCYHGHYETSHIGAAAMAIVNRIDQLMREKAVEWERDITASEISEKTGIAESTFSRMRSDPKGIRFDVLNALCAFFGVQPGAILVYVPDDASGETQADRSRQASPRTRGSL